MRNHARASTTRPSARDPTWDYNESNTFLLLFFFHHYFLRLTLRVCTVDGTTLLSARTTVKSRTHDRRIRVHRVWCSWYIIVFAAERYILYIMYDARVCGCVCVAVRLPEYIEITAETRTGRCVCKVRLTLDGCVSVDFGPSTRRTHGVSERVNRLVYIKYNKIGDFF